MASFSNDGVEIAYDDIAPQGPAERTVVLVHGFASNRREGWRRTGWYDAFARRRARVIALDQRGHGQSAKLYDPADYLRSRMAGDVLALMDHLAVGRCDLFGYSMGTRTAMTAAGLAPDRFSNLILGGTGGRILQRGVGFPREAMAEAMLTDDPQSITEPMLKSFRQFADEQGEDRRALAAVTQSVQPPLDLALMGALPMPVLVAAGDRDEGAGDPSELARIFPHGKAVTLRGCDHFNAIPHASTKAAVFDFLEGFEEDDFPPFE